MSKDEHEVNSIYDLAELAGVSHATVSRVFSGKGRVSDETKRKILTLAEEANFKPQQKARKTTIAMVCNYEDVTPRDEYYLHLMLELFKQIGRHDLSMDIFSTHNLSTLRRTLVDGILFMPWSSLSKETVDSLPPSIPRVVPNISGTSTCSQVMSDHFQSGMIAANYFIKYGHKKSAILVSDLRSRLNSDRLRGFTSRFAKAGCGIPDSLVFNLAENSIDYAMQNIINQGVTSVFLADESKVLPFMMTVKKLGISIPNDLSAIAMESYELNTYQDPPLTSIQQPLTTIATKSLELLLRKIHSGDYSTENIILDNSLLERASVAKI